jgi:hypothetical protein
MFYNGEAESRATELAGTGLIDAVEALENSIEVLLGDSNARV